MANNRPPYHRNGTATGTPATVDCSRAQDGVALANALSIKNTGGTNNLLVSFDGGTTFATVEPSGGVLSVIGRIASMVVKSSAATTSYETVLVSNK